MGGEMAKRLDCTGFYRSLRMSPQSGLEFLEAELAKLGKQQPPRLS